VHYPEPPPDPPPQLSPDRQHFACELRFSGHAAAWIHGRGDLDLAATPQFEQALQDALPSALLIIVDLRQLTFMDSTGVHMILEADARARRSARRLVFLRGPAQIDRLFELVGLSSRLAIIDLEPALVSTPAATASATSDAA
jgi:anti-anti-sigma factor